MTENKLPERGELVLFETLKMNYDKKKKCTCKKPDFEIDMVNEEVRCRYCNTLYRDFEVIKVMAKRMKEYNEMHERRYEQAKEMEAYKPWLRAIKSIERMARKKDVLPICPNCEEPFFLEDLTNWMGKKFAVVRIAIWKEKKQKGAGST